MLLNFNDGILTVLYPADYTEDDIQNLIKNINDKNYDKVTKIILLNRIVSLQLILYIFEKFNESEIVLEEEPYNILISKAELLNQKYSNLNLTLNKGNSHE